MSTTHETEHQNIAPNTTPMDGTMWWIKGYTGVIDPQELTDTFRRFLDEAGFTRIKSVDHLFLPEGYTRLDLIANNSPTLHFADLLAESHFAIHTFPPKRTYFELSSCVEAKWSAFLRLLEADPEKRFQDIEWDIFSPNDFAQNRPQEVR